MPEAINPTVRVFVEALNAGDRDAFFALLTDDATMSDDGTDRDLPAWVEKEAFGASGRLEIDTQSADGLYLVADYTNATWGEMRTRWRFVLDEQGTRVSRFETGQA